MEPPPRPSESPFRTPQRAQSSPFQHPNNSFNTNPHGLFTPPTPTSRESSTKPTSSLARRRRSSVLTSPGGAQMGMQIGGLGIGGGGVNGQVFASAPSSPSGAGWMGGNAFGGMLHGGGDMEVDPFDHISQAMTLLSLNPSSTAHPQPRETPEQPQWPDTEELLKESLRQSLSALRALQAAKKFPPNLPAERLRAVEAALTELRGAGQMLVWAEQQAEVERREVLENGMKGGG